MSRSFPLGRVIATPAALAAASTPLLLKCLTRHARGDWGDIDPEDRGVNEAALVQGARIMSVYKLADDSDERSWIITEADRSSTTVLLPSDY